MPDLCDSFRLWTWNRWPTWNFPSLKLLSAATVVVSSSFIRVARYITSQLTGKRYSNQSSKLRLIRLRADLESRSREVRSLSVNDCKHKWTKISCSSRVTSEVGGAAWWPIVNTSASLINIGPSWWVWLVTVWVTDQQRKPLTKTTKHATKTPFHLQSIALLNLSIPFTHLLNYLLKSMQSLYAHQRSSLLSWIRYERLTNSECKMAQCGLACWTWFKP